MALSPRDRDLDLHLNERSSADNLRWHLHTAHDQAGDGVAHMPTLRDRHHAAHGPAYPEPRCSGRIFDIPCSKAAGHEGYYYCPRGDGAEPAAGLSDRLRKTTDEAHAVGLRTAGYHAALDDVSILLAEKVQRLEDRPDSAWGSDAGHGFIAGLRWALCAIEARR